MTVPFDIHIRSVAEHLRAYDTVDPACLRSKSISLFYAGLHLISAVAGRCHGQGFRVHRERKRYMYENHGKTCQIYTDLYDLGEQARYDPDLLRLGTPEYLHDNYRVRVLNNGLIVWASNELEMPDLNETISTACLIPATVEPS